MERDREGERRRGGGERERVCEQNKQKTEQVEERERR